MAYLAAMDVKFQQKSNIGTLCWRIYKENHTYLLLRRQFWNITYTFAFKMAKSKQKSYILLNLEGN
jgi:hypothetical protein